MVKRGNGHGEGLTAAKRLTDIMQIDKHQARLPESKAVWKGGENKIDGRVRDAVCHIFASDPLKV